jgi:hypothetical protein
LLKGTIPYDQIGYEQVAAVTASSASLDATKYTHATSGRTANYILVTCEGSAAIRWRADGTGPTTTVGTPLTAGQSLALPLNPKNFKLIATTAGTVSVAYFVG